MEVAPFIHVAVTDQVIESGAVLEELKRLDSNTGAVATFNGLCRSENGALTALELEHYPAMAERALIDIAQKALDHWPLFGIALIHRYGVMRPGDEIVFVAAASRHREAALEAVGFVMDYLKTDAPFWKKEHSADKQDGRWVKAKSSDDQARAKWADKSCD